VRFEVFASALLSINGLWGCDAVRLGEWLPTFREIQLLSSSRLWDRLITLDDEVTLFLRNYGSYLSTQRRVPTNS